MTNGDRPVVGGASDLQDEPLKLWSTGRDGSLKAVAEREKAEYQKRQVKHLLESLEVTCRAGAKNLEL